MLKKARVCRTHLLSRRLNVLTKGSTCSRAQALAYDSASKTYAIGFHRDHGKNCKQCAIDDQNNSSNITGFVGNLSSSNAPSVLNQVSSGLYQINDLTIDSTRQAVFSVGRPEIVTQHNFKGKLVDTINLSPMAETATADACDIHIASEDQNWMATKNKLVSKKDKTRWDIGNGHILFTDPKTASMIVQEKGCLAYFILDKNCFPSFDHNIQGAHLADLMSVRSHNEWKLHCFCPQQDLFICLTENKKGSYFGI